MIKFNVSVKNYSTNAPIYRDDKTIGYKFINTGNSVVYINEVQLEPCDELDTFAATMKDCTLWKCRFDAVNNVNQQCSTSNSNLQVVIFSEV